MPSKAEHTRQFIIETVAPVFNKFGYAGTSMSDLVKATGLTKGAIYGNFENKEQLALHAFNHYLRKVMGDVASRMEAVDDPLGKLYAMTAYYRDYYRLAQEFGGCPILNVGVDAHHRNPLMMERVRSVIQKLQGNIARIIRDGQYEGQIRQGADSHLYSRRIYSLVQGSVFMAITMGDGHYMIDMMDVIDLMIDTELKIE